MTDLTEWYPSVRRAAAHAVAWAEVAAADPWEHGPGLRNALGDLRNCVLADAATRHRTPSERLYGGLAAVVRDYADRVLTSMDPTVPPLAEQEIAAARAELRIKDIEWAAIVAARAELESRSC